MRPKSLCLTRIQGCATEALKEVLHWTWIAPHARSAPVTASPNPTLLFSQQRSRHLLFSIHVIGSGLNHNFTHGSRSRPQGRGETKLFSNGSQLLTGQMSEEGRYMAFNVMQVISSLRLVEVSNQFRWRGILFPWPGTTWPSSQYVQPPRAHRT